MAGDAPPTILAVDDTADNLSLITGLLKGRYRLKVANNGETALRLAQSAPLPDLVLLDILMPGLSGWDVCQALKADPATSHIPVVFLTAMNAPEDETRGLEMGAADFIAKPLNPATLLARVATQLKLKASADFLKDKNAFLEDEVGRRTRELAAIQDVTVLALASLAETRDNETGNHIRRTQYYVRFLARRASEHPKFARDLTPAFIETLFKSAPLHDIGKVGIPDRILLKPGRFEPEEFEIMKTHAVLGREAIQKAEEQLGMDVPFLATAKEIAWCHQEKWDGSGYPRGLVGEAIPLSARIMAIADVYDALISRRVYKEGMPHEKAVVIMKDGRGSHFDPDLTDLFLEVADQFHKVAQDYLDSHADLAAKAKRQEAPH